MATISSPISPSNPPKKALPPLVQGERLNHSEFMARYEAMPDKFKAERIDGVVYVSAAALSAEFHGDVHADVLGWLSAYRAATPGVIASDNSTTALDPDNDPQPDASLRIRPSHGGRTKLDAKGYIEGAPELIIEIAGSTVGLDLGAKLTAYQRCGVNEYLVFRTYDAELDWFVLRDGAYGRLSADSSGVYRSEVFPGLWLDAKAMIEGRIDQVFAVLRRGLATAEHEAFVKLLENNERSAKR